MVIVVSVYFVMDSVRKLFGYTLSPDMKQRST